MRNNILKVLRIIDESIQKGDTSRLSIKELSVEAGMCKRYLQLYFKAFMNEPIGKYIKRVRMERAMWLMKNTDREIQYVAYSVGLQNPPALNNIFRKKLGLTPQDVRTALRVNMPQHTDYPVDYRIEYLPDTHVLSLSFIGSYYNYDSIQFEDKSWNRLYDYAVQTNLLPENPDYWGIAFDDEDITDAEHCRFYACISINAGCGDISDNEIKAIKIPGGRYAVYVHRGAYFLLDDFYSTILRNFKFSLRNSFILERYINSPADVPANELITEVWFPI